MYVCRVTKGAHMDAVTKTWPVNVYGMYHALLYVYNFLKYRMFNPINLLK